MTAGSPVFRTSAVIVLVMGALVSLDEFLAKTESRELQSSAAEAYRLGSSLLEQGKAAQAVEALRKAHVLSRQNPKYELRLGSALAMMGKTGEAESLIDEALEREPDDGEANLVAAHLMVRKGNSTEAKSYFHRAIYGEWGNAGSKIAARLELIDLLEKEKRRPEMLSELISLEEEAGDNTAVQERVARGFMLAGSPARAATVYRALIEKNPADTESLAGLGEAELENGRYRAARNAFLRAAPHDARLQLRLRLLDTLTALDPTPRQLTSLEKYLRSRRILDLARLHLEQLIQNTPQKATPETGELLQAAGEMLAKKEPAHVSNEHAEELLALAERLWRVTTQTFGADNRPDDEALRLLLERLAG